MATQMEKLSTAANLDIGRVLPVSEGMLNQNYRDFQTSLTLGTASNRSFSFIPEYKIVDNKAVELQPALTEELTAVSSLVALGDLLFKNAQPKSEEDSAAMQAYMKRKFKKVKKG